MCDTLGFTTNSAAYFAKNSDRSPNEPQVNEFHPARKNTESRLKTTYIEIGQAKETHAVLLSRPVWMWGAEMGVNDCGVCIGNEAVFTKGSYGKTGLTGMDLLRLALERSDSAKAALELIIDLLEQHGQGGNCGFDHSFFYDNAFLIMDKSELYVLETAGREWVYKKTDRYNISNRLSVGADGTAYNSGIPCDFRKKHSEPLYTHFSGSKSRRALASDCLQGAANDRDLMLALRTHTPDVKHPFLRGSVKSPCMHAGGLVGDHSTASMIVELHDYPKIWLTGSSTPCISLFKPYAFGNTPAAPVFDADDPSSAEYWLKRENFHRGLIGKQLPPEFYEERDALEQSWLLRAEKADPSEMKELSVSSLAEETAFYAKWEAASLTAAGGSRRFLSYWKKKNLALRAGGS